MSELSITGSIKKILPIESGTAKSTGNEWQKQSFIVSNKDGYEGNIGTNEWKDKYFTSLSAWRIEKLKSETTTNEPKAVEAGDLPF